MKQALGGEEPTIISPEAYQIRFRTAMDKYFIAMIPDHDEKIINIMNRNFNAEKIEWFTKKTDKQQLE